MKWDDEVEKAKQAGSVSLCLKAVNVKIKARRLILSARAMSPQKQLVYNRTGDLSFFTSLDCRTPYWTNYQECRSGAIPSLDSPTINGGTRILKRSRWLVSSLKDKGRVQIVEQAQRAVTTTTPTGTLNRNQKNTNYGSYKTLHDDRFR